ncbi:toprim domain-containing protein [Endozoicomonas gorgoniicola]|uniref:Toprim domain-containing protein n=1 Tax=Endozoicomonas gorgoniicola TaxID=1234144 RepID=A0ABT3MW78_9GAMM|nr:toprim domain-containing protein [Endozoicomonas gorgoniicola]MCW7553623.1 toprim domain-containing protein [Endozoicomonas gorgoniicola]
MASIEQLKEHIDLHDLCEHLGMKRDGKMNGNREALYHSPVRDDKNASFSVYRKKGELRWKDHATDEGGSIIDLVIYTDHATDTGEAIRWLHKEYNIPFDKPDAPARERTRVEWLADQVLGSPEEAISYLVDERRLSEEVVKQAISARTLGYSDYTSTGKQPGEKFHGGPAVAFICREFSSKRVTTVEYRYFDKELNGGLKTHCHGEKGPAFWCLSHHHIKAAHTIVLVESPINALSVHCTALGEKGWAGLATMGASNLHEKDWSLLEGKRIICAFDNDEPDKKTGYRAGAKAAWAVHEKLTALNMPCLFVDQITGNKWEGVNDLNDFLVNYGLELGRNNLRSALEEHEPWLVPGLPGKVEKDMVSSLGKTRLFLPAHDYSEYWKFRVKEDFTQHLKIGKDEDGNDQITHQDLCGFRIAGLSRVSIQSATATMSGEKDAQPNTIFAATVQTPRHGNRLQRRVFQDEQLHNPEQWKKFGPIYSPARFSRMLNIMERATDIGARDAINFVGLAWRNGRPVMNEGPDCYFTEPDKQCPYHNLRFPSGPVFHGRQVVEAYQKTFHYNAALIQLVWGLGAHLKAFLGFWPHSILQSNKGAGKSTLVKRLERTVGMTMFGGQSLQTEFRILTSISHTGHPVGWEELSARRQDIIDKAVGMLQECYQFTVTRRGTDMTEYVQCAPVLLAGEDVPVQSLLGKVIRSDLSGRKGDMLPEDLPRFPVREWVKWLSNLERKNVRGLYEKCRLFLMEKSAASGDDDGANRMVGNYAALYCAWRLLCEFLELPSNQGDFPLDLLGTMNAHVTESSADREPWVWIMEIILGEIDANNFKFPYKFERNPNDPDESLLFIRFTHIMQHLSTSSSLRAKFDAMPVKSATVFARQVKDAGVCPEPFRDKERTIGSKRATHLFGLSLTELERFGLSVSVPEVQENGY